MSCMETFYVSFVFSVVFYVYPDISVVKENAATLFCCDASEMFWGLRNFNFHRGTGVR